jgi:multicomponent Na+:H+ antiporter subunit B
MIGVVADVLSWIFLLAGSFFAVVGGIGVIRMPDVFTRLHAAGVTDTMGAGLVLTGLMFQGGPTLITVKLMLILGFLWFSSPVSTYALARAALMGGEEPVWAEEVDITETAKIPGRVIQTSPAGSFRRWPKREVNRMGVFIDFALLALLAVTAIAVVRTTKLFAAVMLFGIFSLLSAGLFTVMDAVDVAFTEAAVGAGISTVLFLATLALVGSKVKTPQLRITEISTKVPARRPLFPLIVVIITGGILIYGTLDMPPYGDPANPIHQHVAPEYLEGSKDEIGIPNVVTSVLAAYRGYDTLGETTVVFTAAVGVMILLSAMRRKDRYGEEGWGEEVVPTLRPSFVKMLWFNGQNGPPGSSGSSGGEGGEA